MRRIIALLIAVFIVVSTLSGCQIINRNEYSKYNKYSDTFFDAFDTLTQFIGYTKSEEEFKGYFEKVHLRFQELHKLYDIYNTYEGINNIKTINDNAGIAPVKVDKDIINLILFAKDWNRRTNGQTNIAMGSVLSIWHDYREAGRSDPEAAKLPPMEALQKAAMHTDIDKVIVDTENSTVFLADKEMSLDVGAVAKGYATEIVAQEIMADGLESGMISAGGNIRALGKPYDGVRERWGIGIQNPDKATAANDLSNLLDIIFLNNASVVSSGDYERYYIVNGKRYHHLIDPETLMPGEFYRAVTIVTEDSGAADALSTAIFLMPYEESRAFVEALEGVEAVWVMKDGRVEATEGMQKIMKSHGAAGTKAK